MNSYAPVLIPLPEAEKISEGIGVEWKDGGKAFAHQIADSIAMAHRGVAIQASEMGTGKTRCALRAAKIIQAKFGSPIVVFCPPSVMHQWENEAAAVGVTINTFSWGKLPDPIEGSGKDWILILDECHRVGNIQAKRTKTMLQWSKVAISVFGVSGTPTLNGRPRELFPILAAISHPIVDQRGEYERKFCNAHWSVLAGGTTYDGQSLHWRCKGCKKEVAFRSHWRRSVGSDIYCPVCKEHRKWPRIFWNDKGGSNLDELNEAIAGVLIRRKKVDCLDLPEMMRKTVWLDATKEEADQYAELQKVHIIAKKKEVDCEGEVLTTMMALRKLASVQKVEQTIAMVKELNEAGEQVIVFTVFIESARAIAAGLKVKAYEGALDADARKKIQEDFLAGKKRNFVGTAQAGGEGINLAVASYVIMVDRPWTMALVEQCESRAHRQGQKWPVTSLWLSKHAIDESVDEVLADKSVQTEAIVGETNGDTQEEFADAVSAKLQG